MSDFAFETEPLDTNPANVPTYANSKEVFTAVAKFMRRKNKRKVLAPSGQTSDSSQTEAIAENPERKNAAPVSDEQDGQETKPKGPDDSQPKLSESSGRKGPPGDTSSRLEVQVVISTAPETTTQTGGAAPSDASAGGKLFLDTNKVDETKPEHKKQEAQQPLKSVPLLPNRTSAAKKPTNDAPPAAADETTQQEDVTVVTMILRSSSLDDQNQPKATPKTSTISLPAITTAASPPAIKAAETKQPNEEAGNTAVVEVKSQVVPKLIGQAEGESVDENNYYYVKTPAVTSLLNDLKFLNRKQRSDLCFEILSNNLEGSVSKKFIPTAFETQTIFFLARSSYFKRLFKFLRLEANKQALLDGSKTFKKIIVRSPYNDDDSASAILNSYDPEIFGDGDLKLVPMDLGADQFSFRILPKVSKKSFTEFMGYLQFGECQLEPDQLIDILKLSTLFETSQLSELIEQHVLPTKHELLDNMDAGSVLELYYLANKNNLASLQRSCEYFINENDSMFINTREWREFLNRKPELVLKLFTNRHGHSSSNSASKV